MEKSNSTQSKHSGNSIFKEYSNQTSTPNWLSVCENSPRGPRGQLRGAAGTVKAGGQAPTFRKIINKCLQGFSATGLLTESQDKTLQRLQGSCGEKNNPDFTKAKNEAQGGSLSCPK